MHPPRSPVKEIEKSTRGVDNLFEEKTPAEAGRDALDGAKREENPRWKASYLDFQEAR